MAVVEALVPGFYVNFSSVKFRFVKVNQRLLACVDQNFQI